MLLFFREEKSNQHEHSNKQPKEKNGIITIEYCKLSREQKLDKSTIEFAKYS